MRNPALAAAGTVIALLGIVFFLQGVGVLKGSSMSNTTTWSVAGPIIALVGLAIAAAGFRGRSR
jgi:drug/metabolite transporter superfamily protein YnfA